MSFGFPSATAGETISHVVEFKLQDVATATVRGEPITANALTSGYAAPPSLPLSGHLSRQRERVLGASGDDRCNSPAANTQLALVLAGDVFYDPDIADQTLAALRTLAETGADILIGDPFRDHLPQQHLALIARYAVADFASGGKTVTAGVFRLRRASTACS